MTSDAQILINTHSDEVHERASEVVFQEPGLVTTTSSTLHSGWNYGPVLPVWNLKCVLNTVDVRFKNKFRFKNTFNNVTTDL